MPVTTADKRATFRKLHESGCFIIPNPVRCRHREGVAQLGFKAMASTSAGFAWTIGKADNHVTVDEVCDHLAAISAAVDIPVNADFESGFAHKPETSRPMSSARVRTGLAGLSIEDFTGDKARPLYERAHAVERIKAARKAIDADKAACCSPAAARPFCGATDLSLVIDRLHGLCRGRRRLPLRAGIKTREEIAAVVKAVAAEAGQSPDRRVRPVVQQAGDLGVRRISVGGSLARTAWGGFMKAAKEIAEKGTFGELAKGYPGGELNKMFS